LTRSFRGISENTENRIAYRPLGKECERVVCRFLYQTQREGLRSGSLSITKRGGRVQHLIQQDSQKYVCGRLETSTVNVAFKLERNETPGAVM
jgi:hypothetical protein